MSELEQYDYDLPREMIARHPLPQRDAARLMVVDRYRKTVEHRHVSDLPELLSAGDCLVLNDTQVVPARLFGYRAATGGKWEGLFLETTSHGNWRLMGQTRGRLQPGEDIVVVPAHAARSGDEYRLTFTEPEEDGIWQARPESQGDAFDVLQQFGTIPLPPYIGRPLASDDDRDRYQTVYSRTPGAVAAPTAGLHFSSQLLECCQRQGIGKVTVTLHVGIGTFRPLTDDDFQAQRLHSEWCEVGEKTAKTLNAVRKDGGRIVAVGTTSLRTLESAAEKRIICPFSQKTDLFIRPGYTFQAVDVLLTNFHLPRSSLLVLVSAILGPEFTKRVYETAIRENYRFYSYGDAMLIF